MKDNGLSKENLKKILKHCMPILKQKYSVCSMGIFGSCVRGDQSLQSDVDLLVEFENVPGLFAYIELENYLSGLVGRKVDLVMKGSLKPIIGKQILSEVEVL
jgi:uncharacterized protein